jgi:ubiquinone/menaquinone biosynthesis C-methylase UbiE
MNDFVKLDAWAQSLLVDPVGKGVLSIEENTKSAVSDYGKTYSVVDGVYDFRPGGEFLTKDSSLWKDGQEDYEDWDQTLAVVADEHVYRQELESVADVYENVSLDGDVLDVGGHQGRLRAFLKPGSRYMIVDPYIHVFRGLEKNAGLLATYPFLKTPVNFVCGVAEHLPLKSLSFDTVHMRSVIDHFANPELAMWEAYRVLRSGGALVVGLYVEGGKDGIIPFSENLKNAVKNFAASLGFERWKDHHVWHPTYAQLCTLISNSGFEINQTYWQRSFVDKVVYIKAIKR